MAAGGAKNLRRMLNHEPSWWLRCRLADIDRAALNDRLPACPHANTSRVGIVALWAPGTVWCPACSLNATRLEGDDDHRCDRCAAVVDELTVMTIVSHRLLVWFGLCRSCAAREDGR